eukprot:701032-Prorocentrum_minimum.AAC.6
MRGLRCVFVAHSGDDDGCIKVWDTRQRSCVYTFDEAHHDFVSDMVFNAETNELISGIDPLASLTTQYAQVSGSAQEQNTAALNQNVCNSERGRVPRGAPVCNIERGRVPGGAQLAARQARGRLRQPGGRVAVRGAVQGRPQGNWSIMKIYPRFLCLIGRCAGDSSLAPRILLCVAPTYPRRRLPLTNPLPPDRTRGSVTSVTNQTQKARTQAAWVYSHDAPMRRRKCAVL